MSGDGAIVVGGEALVDLVLAGDADLRPHLGGGPYNVARTLGRLERPVWYLGRLSRDRFGAQLRAGLEADGVRLDAVVLTDDPTTLAIAELDSDGGATYRFYTEGTAAAGLTAPLAQRLLPATVDVLHVGTLGLVMEPTAAALEAVVADVPAETLVVLDPNCRPSAIEDEDGYRARLARVLERTDVVKVSEDDLAWLSPGEGAVAAARSLLEAGPRVALLTRGGEGAVLVTPSREVSVAVEPVDVVDTIGAGDAFGGGFVAWWHGRGLGREDLADIVAVGQAAQFAGLVAARTCARAGADPPRLTELERG